MIVPDLVKAVENGKKKHTMNQRIKELLEQAGVTYVTMPKDTVYEKFAESIVTECLDVVAMRIYLGNSEMCIQECKALAADIKEHFGVG